MPANSSGGGPFQSPLPSGGSQPVIPTGGHRTPRGGGIKLPGLPKGPVPYVVGAGLALTAALVGYQLSSYSPPTEPDFNVDTISDVYIRDLAKTQMQGEMADALFHRTEALPAYSQVAGGIEACKGVAVPAGQDAFTYKAACFDSVLANYQAGLEQIIADANNPASAVYIPVGSAMSGVEERLALLDQQLISARAGIADTLTTYRNGMNELGRLAAERAAIQREQDAASAGLTQATYERMQTQLKLDALTAYNVREDAPLSGVRRWFEDAWEMIPRTTLEGELSRNEQAELSAQAVFDDANLRASAKDLEIKGVESILLNGEATVMTAYVGPTLSLLGDTMGYSGQNDARDAQLSSVPEELAGLEQLSYNSIPQDSRALVEKALADARAEAEANKTDPSTAPIATGIGAVLLTIAAAAAVGRKKGRAKPSRGSP